MYEGFLYFCWVIERGVGREGGINISFIKVIVDNDYYVLNFKI